MWKSINGYEGYYEINEYGVIKSLDRYITKSNGITQLRKSRVLTQRLDKDGYCVVKLSKEGNSKIFRVARLVALAFVDGYNEGLEPNHLDCDRTNNYYKNLEWVSHVDNVSYTKSLKRHVSDRDLSGSNNPNYNNDTLRKRYEQEPKLRMVQSRPGAKNGRCRKVKLINGNKEIVFDYLSECANYLINNGFSSSKSVTNVATLLRIAAENNKEYLGLMFELI